MKDVIAQLEDNLAAAKSELAVRRGEPVFHHRETIRKVARKSAARHMNSGTTSTPSHPPFVDNPAPSADKKVSFEESLPSRFVEVKRKRNHRRRSRRPENANPVPDALAAPVAPSPSPLTASTPLTGAAMYSRVATASPLPPVPHASRPSGQVRTRLVKVSPQVAALPRVSSASPRPNARVRHITMRFATGKRTQLPVTPDTIRIRINQSLSNMDKVANKTPYIREACSKLEIRCIYLTLADHTADQVWGRLD